MTQIIRNILLDSQNPKDILKSSDYYFNLKENVFKT